MTNKQKSYGQFIEDLADAGIFFAANHCTGGQIDLSINDVIHILTKGWDSFNAECYGITVGQFKAYRENCQQFDIHRGTVQCAGKTSKGKRCKHITHAWLEPDEWVKISSKKQYCHIHNKRQEAKR